jgi:hypothetical protein
LYGPFVAEFLLADQYLAGPPSFAQLGEFALFILLYGAGAVFIRELTRRTGRGWPTMVLLALAYGVVEEGLLTQSLFNPGYLNAHLLDHGFIPALGIAAPWTVYVLTLHTVWSIGAPIAVLEGRTGNREPWLGKVGLGVTGGLYVLGAAATFAISYAMSNHYVATLPQLAVAALVAVVLVVVALTRRPVGEAPARRVSQGAAFALGLAFTSAFQLTSQWKTNPAMETALMLAILLAGGLVVARWTRGGAFGLGAGAVVTYCWLGLLTATGYGTAAVVEQAILVGVAIVVVAVVSVFGRLSSQKHSRATIG